MLTPKLVVTSSGSFKLSFCKIRVVSQSNVPFTLRTAPTFYINYCHGTEFFFEITPTSLRVLFYPGHEHKK